MTTSQIDRGGGGGGGGGASPIDELDELSGDVALNDFIDMFDTSADENVKVPVEDVAAYIKPDANGHPPTPADDEEAEAYVDAGLPCLVDGVFLYPKFEFTGGHSALASWLYFNSEPNVAAVGDIEADAWADATDYVVGDVVLAGGQTGTVAVCIQDHTSTDNGGSTATDNPDDDPAGGNAYWDTYTASNIKTVTSNFVGVVETNEEFTNPQNNDWAYILYNHIPYSERYLTAYMGWQNYVNPNIHRMLGFFERESDTLDSIQVYTSSQHTYAVIGTRLARLLGYTPPAAANRIFHWRRKDFTGRPRPYDDASSLSGLANVAIDTGIKIPTSQWAWVNFGDIGSDRQGTWHRFLVQDLRERTNVDAGAVIISDDNSLMFFGDTDDKIYLLPMNNGNIAVAGSADTIVPAAVRIRTD